MMRPRLAVLVAVLASGIGIGWTLAQHSISHPLGIGEAGPSHLLALTGATQSHYPPNWRYRLLALVGAPATTQNLRLLSAWGISEGGTAKWNPLNGTYVLSYGESWSYNSSSVQNYWRPTGGIAANVLVLIQDNYACILGALQQATLIAEDIVTKCAAQFRTWGTNPETIKSVLRTT